MLGIFINLGRRHKHTLSQKRLYLNKPEGILFSNKTYPLLSLIFFSNSVSSKCLSSLNQKLRSSSKTHLILTISILFLTYPLSLFFYFQARLFLAFIFPGSGQHKMTLLTSDYSSLPLSLTFYFFNIIMLCKLYPNKLLSSHVFK